jgi:hypothetical protein
MKFRVPNLFLAQERGEDYHLYLSNLMLQGNHKRIIQVCRRIRAYAARGPGQEAALFTYFYEHNALCELGRYSVAWRQLLRRDRICRGADFDFRSFSWSRDDSHDLRFLYGPLLYLIGRFAEAAAMFEKALEFECHGKNGSYETMYTVANDDAEPGKHYRVTLLHCYRRLGRPLTEWAGWLSFIKKMHPQLFRMAKIDRESMLTDPGLLINFQIKLERLLEERTQGSGGTWGICDLLDPPSKVRKRHAATIREIKQFQERIRSRKTKKERELAQAFHDYQPLPERNK